VNIIWKILHSSGQCYCSLNSITKCHEGVPLGNTQQMSINRSVFYGENVFYSQAGNRVSPIYCISYRVEGKPGLITVGRILLNCILILCETNFEPELQSHVVCSAVEKGHPAV